MEIEVRPITPADWPAIVGLFGTKGACGGCWCMHWRVPKGGKAWEEAKGKPNRDRFRRLVKSGKVDAVMAFANGEPIGWCTDGPRETFPRLKTVRALQRELDEGSWAVVCFYVHVRWRGEGVGVRLLQAAVEQARASGATELEGFPVVPKSPKRLPAAFAWTGVPEQFKRAGFKKLRRKGETRPIYVVDLRGG